MRKWISGAAASLVVVAGIALALDGEVPTSGRLAVQVGLTPEALAASGVDAVGAAALLVRLEAATEDVTAFDGATLALDAAINNLVAMDRTLEANPDDEETSTARETLAGTLPSLHARVSSTKNALIAVGLQGFESETRSRLERFMSAAGSTLPAAMRVCPLSVGERRSVEAAIRAEQRAVRMDVPLKSERAAALSSCRSHPDVVAASVSLSSNLAAIKAVYAGDRGQ